MKLMNAKEYAASRGLPLATVRKLCRHKILKYLLSGRVYLIDIEAADTYFNEHLTKPSKPAVKHQPVYSGQNFGQRLASLRAELL